MTMTRWMIGMAVMGAVSLAAAGVAARVGASENQQAGTQQEAAGAQETREGGLIEAQGITPQQVETSGRVQATVAARIGPRVSGHIAAFGTNDKGEMLDAGMMVQEGQALFRLNSTTFANTAAVAKATLASAEAALANLTARTREERLEQARQAVAELEARIGDKQKDVARYQRLVEEKTAPAKRLEEVQTDLAALEANRKAAAARLQEAENGPTKTEVAMAEARVNEAQAALKMAQDDLQDAVVRAPFTGLITRRFKSPGDYLTATPPTDVVELVNLEKLEAELRLPEAYFGGVAAGKTRVRLKSAVWKASVELPVTRVIEQIDPAKGTFAFRVAIPAEKRAGIAPGAFVTAEVTLEPTAAGGVIVPQRAVTMEDGKAVVVVAEEPGKRVKRVVEVGDKLTEGVILKRGVAPGEKVVVGK